MSAVDLSTSVYEELTGGKMERVAGFKVSTVSFYGTEILGVYSADNDVYIPIKPLCEGMGLAYSGQFERISRTPMLKSNIRMIRIAAKDEKEHDMIALKIHAVPMWLATIETSRIKRDNVRSKIELYQIEATDVLYKYFLGPGFAVNRDRNPGTIEEMTNLKEALKQAHEQNVKDNEILSKLTKQLEDTKSRLDYREKYFEMISCPFCLSDDWMEQGWENPEYENTMDEDGSGVMQVGEITNYVCNVCQASVSMEFSKAIVIFEAPPAEDRGKGKYKNW